MATRTDEHLRDLSLFLGEQINEYGRAVGRVFLGSLATIYRSFLRYTLRYASHQRIRSE